MGVWGRGGNGLTLEMKAGLGDFGCETAQFGPGAAFPAAVFFVGHSGGWCQLESETRTVGRCLDDHGLRQHVGTRPGRGVLDIIVAGHVLGYHRHNVALLFCQQQRAGEAAHAGTVSCGQLVRGTSILDWAYPRTTILGMMAFGNRGVQVVNLG